MLEHRNTVPTPPRRVVIMGAGGFVGGAVAQKFSENAIETLPLGRGDVDLLASGAAQGLAEILQPEDTFIAVSAIAPVKNLEMLEQNVAMLRAMADALIITPVRHAINIGSDAVFADEPHPLTEATPRAPTSLHGVMHLARELAFAEVGVPLATLRPTLIYGAADPHNGYGPNRFLRLAAAGEDIVLFGDGEERRDHVYVEDVAELVLRMALYGSTGSLNAATGHVWSFRQVAEMIAALSDKSIAVKGSPRRGQMPHGGYRPFDADATFRAFPDFRYTDLEDGLKLTRQAITHID